MQTCTLLRLQQHLLLPFSSSVPDLQRHHIDYAGIVSGMLKYAVSIKVSACHLANDRLAENIRDALNDFAAARGWRLPAKGACCSKEAKSGHSDVVD